jgi:hypothetical protein
MKTRFISITAGLTLFCGAAAAMPRFVSESEGKMHMDAVNYDDFHITIISDTAIVDVGAALSDDGAFPAPTIAGQGTNRVNIDWAGLDIPANDPIGLAVSFKLEEWNNYKITKRWTSTVAAIEKETPALGLNVEDDGDYAVTNAYNQIIDFLDLEYAITSLAVPLADEEMANLMEINFGSNPFLGYAPSWTPVGGGTVPANSETLVTPLREFLYSYFQEDFSPSSGEISYTFQQHEHQAPTPTPIALIGVGAIALLRFYKSKKLGAEATDREN